VPTLLSRSGPPTWPSRVVGDRGQGERRQSAASVRKYAHRRRSAPSNTDPSSATPDERALPVTHRQLVLFEIRPDLVAAKVSGFAEPRHAGLASFLDELVTDHARHHGWGTETISQVRRGIRILLGVQDTPGALIRTTDVLLLTTVNLPADPVLSVLEEAGMLIDDRPSSLDRWLDKQLVGLPPMIDGELRAAVEVLRNGSRSAPRMRPRKRRLIQATFVTRSPPSGAGRLPGRPRFGRSPGTTSSLPCPHRRPPGEWQSVRCVLCSGCSRLASWSSSTDERHPWWPTGPAHPVARRSRRGP